MRNTFKLCTLPLLLHGRPNTRSLSSRTIRIARVRSLFVLSFLKPEVRHRTSAFFISTVVGKAWQRKPAHPIVSLSSNAHENTQCKCLKHGAAKTIPIILIVDPSQRHCPGMFISMNCIAYASPMCLTSDSQKRPSCTTGSNHQNSPKKCRSGPYNARALRLDSEDIESNYPHLFSSFAG